MSEQTQQTTGTGADAAQTQTTQQTQAAGSTTATETKASTEQASTTTTTEKKPAAEAFELTLPKDAKVDAKALDAFKALAKEHGIPAKAAQALVDYQFAQQKQFMDAAEKQRLADIEALKADKEFGGPKFEASVNAARSAVKEFGGDELSALLSGAGLDNHPAVVKAFARIRSALAEDTVSGTTKGDAAPNDRKAQLKKMFPNSPEMWGDPKY